MGLKQLSKVKKLDALDAARLDAVKFDGQADPVKVWQTEGKSLDLTRRIVQPFAQWGTTAAGRKIA